MKGKNDNDFNGFWRKGWDSNPRYPCRHAGFQDRCLKPLGHPSKPLKLFSYLRDAPRPEGGLHLLLPLSSASADLGAAPARAVLRPACGLERRITPSAPIRPLGRAGGTSIVGE